MNIESQLMVPVYDYVQSGDKMKKVRVGWAEIIPRDDKTSFIQKTVYGTGTPSKCAICGGRLECRLDSNFLDLCHSPKPLPRGTIVLDGHAILFPKRVKGPAKEFGKQAFTESRKPVFREAADIDEIGRSVSMKVKVLRLWDSRSDKVAQLGLVGDQSGNVRFTIWKKSCQPMLKVGRSYHIRNAVTDYFVGSYQIQATDKTTIIELKNETIQTKSDFINVPSLSLLREDSVIPEDALRVPGIDEPKPTWEDYSATPFISHLDDVEFGDEESDIPPDIDPMDKGLKLKKVLNSLYARNPAKAKEMAARLTPAQWKSIDRIGGLNKDLAFGICKVWEEPEPEGKLRSTEAGFIVITRKEKNAAIDAAQAKRQDKFLINHGFRIKDWLEDLMFRNPAKAKAAAAKLTFYDWQALNYIGGLNTPKTGAAVSR
jgi:hypothetical protein